MGFGLNIQRKAFPAATVGMGAGGRSVRANSTLEAACRRQHLQKARRTTISGVSGMPRLLLVLSSFSAERRLFEGSNRGLQQIESLLGRIKLSQQSRAPLHTPPKTCFLPVHQRGRRCLLSACRRRHGALEASRTHPAISPPEPDQGKPRWGEPARSEAVRMKLVSPKRY